MKRPITSVLRNLTLCLFFSWVAERTTTANEVKLTAYDATVFDQFGVAVAIDGGIALVGSFADSDAGSASGSAYVFDAATGQILSKLTAADAAESDQFGFSVAVNQTIALLGADGSDDAGESSGAAYLFDVSAGTQLAKLTASDATANAHFGWSVDIDESHAIIGAYDDGSSGAAYLFDIATRQQVAKLTASDVSIGKLFGYSVAIDGSNAIVGDVGDSEAGFGAGAAYLFDATTGDQIAKLTASDAANGDRFGRSVAIEDDLVVVGAYGNNDSGSAYLFSATSGQQIAKFSAADGMPGDRFGWSVALSDGLAVIGAYEYTGVGSFSGAAYLFDTTTGNQIAKLTASDAVTNDQFGYSVAIDGAHVVVGAIGKNILSGAAYIYTVPEPTVSPNIAACIVVVIAAGARRRLAHRGPAMQLPSKLPEKLVVVAV